MVSTELRDKGQTLCGFAVRRSDSQHHGRAEGLLAVDVVQALDQLVEEGFLVGLVALPRTGRGGPSTTTVYVMKVLYPALQDIWQKNGVFVSSPPDGSEA